MSWLRLYADAGCLTDEQQKQAEAAVRDYTITLQEGLATAGFYGGDVDGVYGPATVDAVEAKGGAAAQKALASTAAVQQTLKLAGYWDGPVDGDWTPALTEALKEFQKALGVEPSGTVDAATVAALEEALADPDRPRSDSESASPSPSPTGSTSGPSTSTSTSPA